MSTTTSMMGLKVPQMGDPSPGYVSDLSTTINTLDAHDHSVGNGTKVTQAGLNISGALPFNGNSVSGLRSAQFSAQGSALTSPADNGSIFQFGNDLYFLNGANQLVRLTQGATSSGGVYGDYNSSGAQIYYDNAGLQYFFRDSASNLTKGNFGALVSAGITASGNISSTGSLSGQSAAIGSGGLSVTSGAITVNNNNININTGSFTTNNGSVSVTNNITTSTGNIVATTGQISGASASISGNAAVGSLNATGGVLQGSRSIGLRGCVPASSLTTNGSYPAQVYLAGSTPSFAQTTLVAPYAGSIAALTMRAYGAVGTAGTITLLTSGLSTNPTTGAIAFGSLTAGYAATFTPGTYTFAANTPFNLTLTSSGWAQTAGTTGVEALCWIYC